MSSPGAEVPITHAKVRVRLRYDRRRTLSGILLTLPALIVLAITMVYPVAWTVWLSLNGPSTALSGAADFKGLANYARIAGAPGRIPGRTGPR